MYANKMILSMNSPVMKTMYEAELKENDAKEIELPGKELQPFLDLMKIVHPHNRIKGNKKTYFLFVPCFALAIKPNNGGTYMYM